MELLLGELTDKVIKVYYKVYNTLGYGFLEKVYENAFGIELLDSGIHFKSQSPINVYYNGSKVGHYVADIVVEVKLILEIKAMESLREEHDCQLINYLRATDIEVGLLLNFGKKPEFRRKIFQNTFKKTVQIR